MTISKFTKILLGAVLLTGALQRLSIDQLLSRRRFENAE